MIEHNDAVIARLLLEVASLEHDVEILVEGDLLRDSEGCRVSGRDADSLLQEAKAKRQHARGLGKASRR